ncbi:MAG: DUF427 domain-containing protein [Alphaproteobacteria bacterium]|jgi:uncharacterized protein (DUF427 family)|nr:DUF427 domain-containing protein [Alphaproteobacteria bacterium]
MTQAIWNVVVLAESEIYESADENIYFPLFEFNREYFDETTKTRGCPWKGPHNILRFA